MTREDQLKQLVASLVDLGVTQRLIAERMGVHESTLGRWLNNKTSASMRSRSLEGLEAYERQLRHALGCGDEPIAIQRNARGHPPGQPAGKKRSAG